MITKSKNFIIGSEVTVENLGEGVSRQILGYDGQLMMVKVSFEQGSIGSVHEHFHSQCTYVISGTFEVRVKGEKKILVAGDGFYAEPDAEHGVVCIKKGILLDTFSPIRLDFLKE